MSKAPEVINMVDDPFEVIPDGKKASDMTGAERAEWERDVSRLIGHRVVVCPGDEAHMKQATHGTDFTFEIWQGDKIVAHAASPDLVTAQQQATGLALAYSSRSSEPVTVRGVGGIQLQN